MIVTRQLFDYICKDKESTSLTYGSPGVRLFVEGTKDATLKEEKMPAHETYTQTILRKASQAV